MPRRMVPYYTRRRGGLVEAPGKQAERGGDARSQVPCAAGHTRRVARHRVVCFAAVLGAHWLASPTDARDEWQPMFETKTKGAAFTSVLIVKGAGWLAAGLRVVATSRGGQVQEQVIDGLREGFGVDKAGAIYTVGVRASIWRRTDEGDWKLEHQAPATAKFGRSQGMLAGVHLVPHDSSALLVAYGDTPESLLVRSEDGVWKPPSDEGTSKELATYIFEGPPAALPSDCERSYWRWSGIHSRVFLSRRKASRLRASCRRHATH